MLIHLGPATKEVVWQADRKSALAAAKSRCSLSSTSTRGRRDRSRDTDTAIGPEYGSTFHRYTSCGPPGPEDITSRLMTIPGIGPITATALAALAPPPETFRKRAAWIGLTPSQRSTGGKQKLGAVSKMGERTLRRLLVIGASALVHQATRRELPAGSWLARMLATKPRMLVIVALANKMARTAWALLAKKEIYRAPAVVRRIDKRCEGVEGVGRGERRVRRNGQ